MDTQDSIETIEEIAEIIKEYGFDASMEQLFGDELTEQGIDITQSKEDLSKSLLTFASIGTEASKLKLIAILTLSNYKAVQSYLKWLQKSALLLGKADLKSVPSIEWDSNVTDKQSKRKIMRADDAQAFLISSIEIMKYIATIKVGTSIDTNKIKKMGNGLHTYLSDKKGILVPKELVLRQASIGDIGWDTAAVLKFYNSTKTLIPIVEAAVKNIESHVSIVTQSDPNDKQWDGIEKKIGNDVNRAADAKLLKSLISIMVKRSKSAINDWTKVVYLSKIAKQKIKAIK